MTLDDGQEHAPQPPLILVRETSENADKVNDLLMSLWPAVKDRAAQMTPNPHDAEDIAQEAMIKIYRGIKGFREEAKPETWAWSVTTNAAKNWLTRSRRQRNLKPLDDSEQFNELALMHQPEAGVEDQVIGNEEHKKLVKRALVVGGVALTAVLVLYEIYGYSHKDIAKKLGISVGASKVRLHRARAALRADLEIGNS